MLNYNRIKKLKILTTPSQEKSIYSVPQQPCIVVKLFKFTGKKRVMRPHSANMGQTQERPARENPKPQTHTPRILDT